MKIRELANMCLGGRNNTISVERPINPDVSNEVLYVGKFVSSIIPQEISDMNIYSFSLKGTDNKLRADSLRADIVVYVE